MKLHVDSTILNAESRILDAFDNFTDTTESGSKMRHKFVNWRREFLDQDKLGNDLLHFLSLKVSLDQMFQREQDVDEATSDERNREERAEKRETAEGNSWRDELGVCAAAGELAAGDGVPIDVEDHHPRRSEEEERVDEGGDGAADELREGSTMPGVVGDGEEGGGIGDAIRRGHQGCLGEEGADEIHRFFFLFVEKEVLREKEKITL